MKDLKLTDGDIEVINGNIQTVEKTDKLQQQLGKIIITLINNYLHPNYGSEVMNILGQPNIIAEQKLRATVREALDYFITLQKRGVTFDLYDLEEILYKVSYINVNEVVGDPRAIRIYIGIIDGTQKNVEITI